MRRRPSTGPTPAPICSERPPEAVFEAARAIARAAAFEAVRQAGERAAEQPPPAHAMRGGNDDPK